ncbi:MAG TPA: SCO family protein [Stellaceae bacterium]|jgi:protein SCO1/2|nr:SCO family protein [Stellaceae bacterium]
MARTSQKPPGSPRFALIAVAMAGLLILAAGALIGFMHRDTTKGAAGTALAGLIGGPFHLIDQNGKPFTDADLKGKWNLVFFGYTHCPDTCPTALNELSLALDKLGKKAGEVRIVLISVDPERDTPAVLKSYVESFDAPIVALSGTPEEVKQAAASYRVYYAKHPRADGGYDMDHSALIYVMDPQGRFTSTFAPDDQADAISKRLEKLLS